MSLENAVQRRKEFCMRENQPERPKNNSVFSSFADFVFEEIEFENSSSKLAVGDSPDPRGRNNRCEGIPTVCSFT